MNGKLVRERIKQGPFNAPVADRLAGPERPAGGRGGVPDRADAPADAGGGRPLRDSPRRQVPEPDTAARRPVLGADQLDGVLMEPLAHHPGLDRRGFFQFAGPGRRGLADAGRPPPRPRRRGQAAGSRPSRSSCSGCRAGRASSRRSTRTPAPTSPPAPGPSTPPSRACSSPRAWRGRPRRWTRSPWSARWSARKGDHERGTYTMKTGYPPRPDGGPPVDRRDLLPRAAGRRDRHPAARQHPAGPVAGPRRLPRRPVRRLPHRRPGRPGAGHDVVPAARTRRPSGCSTWTWSRRPSPAAAATASTRRCTATPWPGPGR